MRPALIVVLSLACARLASAQAPPASEPTAEGLAEAKRHYDLGRKLYDEKDYDAAFAELTRAYEIAPTPNLFYNLGLVHVARRDYSQALTSLERYLQEASAISAERRREVQTLIDTAKARVASLEVKAADAGVDVFIDDVLVGKTPLEKPVVVNAGEHRVRISQGGKLATLSVIVTGGEHRSLEMNFEPTTPSSEPKPVTGSRAPAREQRPESAPGTPPIWIGWVATGVLAAGATFTGFRALSKQNELDDQAHERGVTRDQLDSTHKQMKTYALVTDILIVGALATGAVTTYFSLKSGSERGSSARLEIRVGPGSAALWGRF